MRRLLGTVTVALAITAGTAACGGNDDEVATDRTTTTTTVPLGDNGLTGAAAVDKYCELVKQALAASEGTGPDGGKNEDAVAVAQQLKDAYVPAFRATKSDPKLLQRFVDCAKVGTAKSPVTTAAGGGGTAGADPTPQTAQALVGLSEAEAKAAAEANGWTFRVGQRDGEQFPLTKDYRAERVTVTVADDKVTVVNIG